MSRDSYSFEVDYRYEAGASFGHDERYPIMVAWTTAPKSAEQAPAAFHRHRLRPHRKTTVRVAFPFDARQTWSQDTSVRFLLLTALRSSEGKWTWAKTASAQVYLADLMASSQNRKGTESMLVEPMQIQSYYMPPPGKDDEASVTAERHKGDLHVRLAPTETNRAMLSGVQWKPPDPLDLTPVNESALQAAMMLTVARSMSPFGDQVLKTGALRMTLPELRRVHAPLYVQETPIPLDGCKFWLHVPDVARQHVDHHGGTQEANRYLHTLLQQSLARHNMSPQKFVEAARIFDRARRGLGTKGVSDAQIHRAVQVVATASTMRGNAMRYAADRVFLPESKEVTVVESFDQVDIRTGQATDTGGVRSYELPTTATTNVPTASKMDSDKEDDPRDTATGGAEDCEDVGRDAAVHFVLMADPDAGIPDAAVESPLLKAARSVASHYRVVGVLTSVLGRNLSDGTKSGASSGSNSDPIDDEDDDFPTIGSSEDRNVEVGAHMFALMVPQRVLETNVNRALQTKRAGEFRVDLGVLDTTPSLAKVSNPHGGYLQVPKRSPLNRNRELPVALCEGTGILDPLMLAREHYVQGIHAKCAAALTLVLDQEAAVRLRTGKTSSQLAKMVLEASLKRQQQQHQEPLHVGAASTEGMPPEVLEKFNPMHRQEWLIDHTEKRVVPRFYRTAAELYLVPTSAQLAARRRLTTSTDDGIDTLAGDRMIPLQIGSRHGGKSGKATWGLAVSDILRQRSFVGFLPTPAPSALETQIDDRVHSHVAPAVALHLDTDLGHDKYIQAAMRWQKQLRHQQPEGVHAALDRLKQQYAGFGGSKIPQRTAFSGSSPGALHRRYALIHGYAHPKDLTDSSMKPLLRWLSQQNSHVVAADLQVERFTYRLAMVRLDTLMDTGARTADRAEPRIEATFRRHTFLKAGLNVIPSGCSLPQQGSFSSIMQQHVDLLLAYIQTSWSRRHGGQPASRDDPYVQQLFAQFVDWGEAIDGRTSQEAYQRYRVVWQQLTNRRYAIMPSPGQLWVGELMRDHVVYTKRLADASWYSEDDPEQRRRRQEALQHLTGTNAERCYNFWRSLILDSGLRTSAVYLWKGHLTSVVACIDRLKETGNPKNKEFRKAETKCKKNGRAFGEKLDAAFLSMKV